MKAISLKVDENVLKNADQIVEILHTNRNKYINKALEYYNKKMERNILAAEFAKASSICRNESMNVLHEFEILDDEANY